jgi:RsmE family RNA methyltransferase
MEHYYTPSENILTGILSISGEEAKHLVKVLRKEKGSEILVTNGTGDLYYCSIDSVTKNEVICRINNRKKNVNEPGIKLTAYISLLKNPARFEFAIEKLTELGAYSIHPVITERVISKEKDKTERWQAIALGAMKQSQRCYLPKVHIPVDFKEAVTKCGSEVKLIAHEKADLTTPLPALQLRQEGMPPLNMEFVSKPLNPVGQAFLPVDPENNFKLLPDRNVQPGSSETNSIEKGKEVRQQAERQGVEVALFIGPEGGFTDGEIKLAEANNFQVFSLGPRKYRSETAAVAAAVLIFSTNV